MTRQGEGRGRCQGQGKGRGQGQEDREGRGQRQREKRGKKKTRTMARTRTEEKDEDKNSKLLDPKVWSKIDFDLKYNFKDNSLYGLTLSYNEQCQNSLLSFSCAPSHVQSRVCLVRLW